MTDRLSTVEQLFAAQGTVEPQRVIALLGEQAVGRRQHWGSSDEHGYLTFDVAGTGFATSLHHTSVAASVASCLLSAQVPDRLGVRPDGSKPAGLVEIHRKGRKSILPLIH